MAWRHLCLRDARAAVGARSAVFQAKPSWRKVCSADETKFAVAAPLTQGISVNADL
jgi:hypothetical protein